MRIQTRWRAATRDTTHGTMHDTTHDTTHGAPRALVGVPLPDLAPRDDVRGGAGAYLAGDACARAAGSRDGAGWSEDEADLDLL